ncbi:MAG: pyridoxamine kinase [Bacilli bacterium]|nr:pyridoxamine kinase [Bacilli bacterium]
MNKKILTIQDISCFGQCSLTVALPIISAMGIEACILPSAILSTHTYQFKGYTFRDLTEDLPLISKHWKQEKLTFDGIYTGYIGSTKQIGYIKQIIKDFKKNGDIVCVDPAMADHGKLYPGFDNEFVKEMKTLCAMADYIVPNITEACYLLEKPYMAEYTKEDIEALLKELASIGCPNVLLTGVSFKKGELGVASYNKEKDEINYYFRDQVPYFFHGTGDVYASCFFGALIKGFNLQKAMKIATDFTVDSILETVEDRDEHWYGVHFESALPKLITSLKGNE